MATMTAQGIQSLPELRPPSGKQVATAVVMGLTHYMSLKLIKTVKNPKGPGFITVPATAPLQNLQAQQRLATIPPGPEDGLTKALNTSLLGGESYPALSAVLSAAVGVVSGGAGLLFTLATGAIDASRTSQRILARPGDEVWLVEEIGKVRNGSSHSAVHVGSYFLVDPFRKQAPVKGWLIHEWRTVLTL